jgi:hypothetical protein
MALGDPPGPDVGEADPPTLVAIAADQIVTLRSILERAARTAGPAAVWRTVPRSSPGYPA